MQYLSGGTNRGHRADKQGRHAVTPKKIDFDEGQSKTTREQGQAQGSGKKHFLALISPIKRQRCSSALGEIDQKENIVVGRGSVTKGKAKDKEKDKTERDHFNKRNVTRSINNIKEGMSSMHEQLKNVK